MKLIAALSSALALAACATNPHTGRSQLLLVSPADEHEMGVQAYQEMLGQATLSKDPREIDPVRRVGARIAAVADRPDFKWEFNVIVDDKTANAWCLPGGKIAFYTGIFPVLQDEAGMAFVMGHEVAHALLRHGGERVSQGVLAQGLGEILSATIGGKSQAKREAVLGAYGVVAGVAVILPFSREHESEADAYGLELMAKAGYDPRASVEVWKRMAQMSGGQPPEFLSTHPSHGTRIEDLEARMRNALALYEQASNKPSVAALPPIPGDRAGKPSDEALAAGLALSSATTKTAKTDDGRATVAFEVSFPRDVYLQEVRVAGPGGYERTIEVKQGIAANAVRRIQLEPDPPPPNGTYTVSFEGRADSARWSSSKELTVP